MRVTWEDYISCSEQDLQWFYTSLDRSSEEIKFVVQDLQTADPTNTIASTSSMDSNRSDPSQSAIVGSDDKFKLFCRVRNKSERPFSVDVGMSKTVDGLKKVIKEKEPKPDYIVAGTLDI